LVSDHQKALDQAREAAIADAGRNAEVYAQASGLQLRRVEWITEDAGFPVPVPMRAQEHRSDAVSCPSPLARTLRVRVRFGFVLPDEVERKIDDCTGAPRSECRYTIEIAA